MITITRPNEYTEQGAQPVTVYCLSTDSKPTNVPNGSMLIEMNTQKVYFFNKTGSAWVEFCSFAAE